MVFIKAINTISEHSGSYDFGQISLGTGRKSIEIGWNVMKGNQNSIIIAG